ncbi:RICIN domain-containing protein [Streptomyces albireticuli]|uniref:RICIN domain-containing protein n=1 Tax=Streptomyces albireticuli TaxID=1940 RepID=UPI003688486B
MMSATRTSARTALVALLSAAALSVPVTASAGTGSAPASAGATAGSAQEAASPKAFGLAPNELWELRRRDNRYEIANRHSGLCLKVKGASRDNEAPVVQDECGTAPEKLWKAETTDGGRYMQLRNSYSNKCMDISGGVAHRGVKIIQYDCTGALNQKWWDTDGLDANPGWWVSATTPSGAPTWMCLDMPGASTAPGVQAAMWDCVS